LLNVSGANNTGGEVLQQERRKSIDRRIKTISPLSLKRFWGRRKRFARSDDTGAAKELDWYHAGYLVLSISILILCAMDSHNTLALLQLGGRELNPFMDVLLKNDINLFVMGKFALTGLGLMLLVAYHHHRFLFFRVRHSLYFVFTMYAVLIGYQLMIFPDDINIFFPH